MGQKRQDPPSDFTKAVHAEIRGWRGKRNISQRKLSELTGIPNSTLSQIIGTDQKPLDMNELEAICNALGVSPEVVVEDAVKALEDASRASYALAAKKKSQLPEPEESDYF